MKCFRFQGQIQQKLTLLAKGRTYIIPLLVPTLIAIHYLDLHWPCCCQVRVKNFTSIFNETSLRHNAWLPLTFFSGQLHTYSLWVPAVER
jgi:hypothetical protein